MDSLCSIIIPVYNEEKNIITCIDSILKQKYKNIEIIFIDDGSIDSSAFIIKQLTLKYENIKYIYQSNSGAASARFSGLQFARGNHIAFLDCDDWLDENSISLAMHAFEDPEIDFSLFDLQYTNKINIKSFNYYTKNVKVIGNEAFSNSINNWGLHGFGVIKKNILIDSYSLYLKENTSHINYLNNDEIITRLCFLNSKYIYLSKGKYFFYFNENSTTRRINNAYFNVIYNSIILHKLILNNYKSHALYNKKSLDLIAKTSWGVFLRYLKWRNNIDKKSWIPPLDFAVKYYEKTKEPKSTRQIIKMKLINLYFNIKNKI